MRKFIAKYANSHGTVNAIKHFGQDFQTWLGGEVSTWSKKDEFEWLYSNLWEKRENLTAAWWAWQKALSVHCQHKDCGGTINKHVIYGILMGLIKSDLGRYGQYLNFVITNGWLQSLYQRMNLTQKDCNHVKACYHQSNLARS